MAWVVGLRFSLKLLAYSEKFHCAVKSLYLAPFSKRRVFAGGDTTIYPVAMFRRYTLPDGTKLILPGLLNFFIQAP
jgi:hypothetical protein